MSSADAAMLSSVRWKGMAPARTLAEWLLRFYMSLNFSTKKLKGFFTKSLFETVLLPLIFVARHGRQWRHPSDAAVKSPIHCC